MVKRAKSIIDLHEGSLEIDVDGDLFRITIMLGLFNTPQVLSENKATER
jgi:hypothetical protein